jgi:addiction module HigA family antidote
MKMSRVGVNAILNGRRAITPDTALRLERVLGPSAQFWLNLQMIVEGRLRSG